MILTVPSVKENNWKDGHRVVDSAVKWCVELAFKFRNYSHKRDKGKSFKRSQVEEARQREGRGLN